MKYLLTPLKQVLKQKKEKAINKRVKALRSLESYNLGGKDFSQIKNEME